MSIFVRPEAHALSFVAPRMRVPKPLFVLHTQFAYTHHARHEKEAHFWLFAIYDKDETEDLSSTEKKALKSMLDTELEARQ